MHHRSALWVHHWSAFGVCCLECIGSALPGVRLECAAWSAFGVRCLERRVEVHPWCILTWKQVSLTWEITKKERTTIDAMTENMPSGLTVSVVKWLDCMFQLTFARKLSIFLWWLQQAFWRPNWNIIQNLTLKMTYSFGMVSVWLKKYFLIIAVLVKTTLMHCPLQKLELVDLEVKKAGFHADSCWLAPFNSQTIWTHKIQYSPTTVYW